MKTTFTYHSRNGKETSLLKSKFIQRGENILKREFYTFDGNAGCVLKIEDDGNRSSPEDLTGVKCRKVIRFINLEDNFAGLPLQIDVWGSNGQSEQRISRTILTYDRHGYVEKEAHYDSNNVLAFDLYKVRDQQGNIISEIDPFGQTTARKYNEYGSLIEEHIPSLKYYTEYTYDWLQRPITITRKCSDGIHLTTSRRYDLEGKLKAIKDQYGCETKYAYNELGQPVLITHPPIRRGKGQWVRPRDKKEYNFLGHLISETDANGAITLYTPNDAGLPLKISYPDGTNEEFRYSIYGELLTKIQRNGSKVRYSYDDFSRPIAEEIFDRDGKLLKKCSKKYSGLLLEYETDGEGVQKSYTYDYAGRVSEIRQGDALTKYLYDSLGRPIEEQRFFGGGELDYIATRSTYDLLNRIIKKEEIDGNGRTHSRIETTYDSDGNTISITTWTHAGSATTTNTYDARGHLSSTTDPLGHTTYYNHRYDFFFEGKNLPCLEVIDPAGVKTTTISDFNGAAILIQIHSPHGELLSDTEMFYDRKRNLVRKEQHLPSENIVTLWKFDSSSRLVQQVNGAGTPEQITTTFVYNAFGELSETHYADGTSKHRIYDELGRLLEEWSDDKSIHYQYSYNGQSLLTKALNCNTKKETLRKYTPEGNLSSEHSENGLEIRYLYDRTNRLIECIYPDETSVRQTYNPVFLKKAERIKKNRVIYTTTFSDFGKSGKPQNIKFPKRSGKLTLEYDRLNRPISLSYPHYQENKICFDSRGLLISKSVNGELQTFDHDPLQQLVLEKTTLYSHTYENDALNRQTSVDGCTQIHNAVHQLTKGCSDAYEYDAKGRRRQDSTTTYTYDKFDRLIEVAQGRSNWSYTYDAFNRRMSRTVLGETTYYLYDGHEDIGSYNSEQKCIDLKVLSASEGSIPIAIELKDQQYAPHISSQGHIVGLIEMETGELADQSFLTLFGKDLSEKPLSPWRFCGKRHEDAALGIIDFGYRFYHPKTAQWLTQDPLGESDGPNLYAYVKNNPACFVDRFNLFGDGFSFSSAWDSFKETCRDCWNAVTDSGSAATQDTATDYSSTTFDAPIDQCSLAANVAPDYTESSPSFLSEQGPGFGSFALDCIPVVGSVKSGWEFIVGTDPVTGEETNRWIALAGIVPCGKILTNVGKGVKKICNASSRILRSSKATKFLPYTANNFRSNLKKLTGISPPSNVHGHHIYPKEHAKEFGKRGINVHDPKHGAWFPAGPHMDAHGIQKYNDVWDRLLKQEPLLSKEQLYQEGRAMMNEYGIKVYF